MGEILQSNYPAPEIKKISNAAFVAPTWNKYIDRGPVGPTALGVLSNEIAGKGTWQVIELARRIGSSGMGLSGGLPIIGAERT